MKRIILVTGGQQSGKSSYAEQTALSLSSDPVYLATSRIWDEEFRKRVERHRAGRGPQWTNLEEEKMLSRQTVAGRVVVIDCVTLWCTNFFFDLNADVQAALDAVKREFDAFTAQEAVFIFVTNEIGSGGVADNPVQRKFTDLQGWVNQYIASRADQVVWMVSGIPVSVKHNGCPVGSSGSGPGFPTAGETAVRPAENATGGRETRTGNRNPNPETHKRKPGNATPQTKTVQPPENHENIPD